MEFFFQVFCKDCCSIYRHTQSLSDRFSYSLPSCSSLSSIHPPSDSFSSLGARPSTFYFCLPRSLPVLQCDVTIRDLMCRILRVLHSSFLTHTAQMKPKLTHYGIASSLHLNSFSQQSGPSVPHAKHLVLG